jgi:imidazolonepropionase-like amidohydrolase
MTPSEWPRDSPDVNRRTRVRRQSITLVWRVHETWKVFDSGVPIVLGTDSGFFGVFLGVSMQIELELLVEAGLKPEDALRAATINAARMIGREKDLGTVERGKLADLVILDGNPLVDIRNVTKIYRTLKGGVVYEPVDPARATP